MPTGLCRQSQSFCIDSRAGLSSYYYPYYYYLTFHDASGRPIPITPGDTIEIEGQSINPTPTPFPSTATPAFPGANAIEPLSQLTTISVPTLTVSLDPQANTITGQAPPGASLTLQVMPYEGFSYPGPSLTTTVDAQGTYGVSLAGVYTLAPGDRVRAIYLSPDLFSFYAENVVPLAQALLYQSQVQGRLSPLTPYTISLTSSRPITALTSGYAAADGQFTAYLTPMLVGDSLVITTPDHIWQTTLPSLSAHVDRATATVYGQALPGARLQVDISESSKGGASQIVTATATGVYTATFQALAPFQSVQGTLVYLNPDGFQTALEFATPLWQITLGSAYLTGFAEAPGSPITLTLQAGDGTGKGEFTTTAGTSNGWFAAYFPQTIQPADLLKLAYPTGVTTFTVPNLTAEHDYARQALEGQATPGSAIVATFFPNLYYPYSYIPLIRRTQADINGHYGMDTSDLDISLGQTDYVVMTDEAGNTIQRNFTVLGYPVYLPVISR